MQVNDTPISGSLERFSALLPERQGKRSGLPCSVYSRLCRWFILEGEAEGNDTILFGIVIGLMEDEYGYISLNELSEVELDLTKQGYGKLQVRQQQDFQPTPLKKLQDNRLQRFLARFED